MYAIIDIETTGGNPHRDRITEIAILLHDGKRIVREYDTLINPERKIPPFVSRMTGITDAMVAQAPRFYEVARQIIELTENAVFVAHNSSFDYHFIQSEFRSLGYEYTRQQLCTYKLSRKLMPGMESYGLGKLCNQLNIPNYSRHRAVGDAQATAILFDMLLEKQPEGFLNGGLLAGKRVINEIPAFIKNLPEKTGVYYLFDKAGEIIYIGKSNNIKKRVAGHFHANSSRKSLEMAGQIAEVNFEITGSELAALLLESDEIKKHQPLFNRRQRRHFFNFGLYSFTDSEGYINFRIEKTSHEGYPIATFSNRDMGKEFLVNLIQEHQLCQNLCGVFGTQGACFYYSVKKCLGACLGLEPAEEYNRRAEAAMDKASMPYSNLLVVDKGRTELEKFLVLIAAGKVQAMGFVMPEQVQAFTPANLENLISPAKDNRDARLIVSSFVRNKRVEKTIPL